MNKEELIRNASHQLFEQAEADAAQKFFSPAYIAHAEEKTYKGHDFIIRFVRQLRKALPDISVVKLEFFISSDNTIAWQRTLQGTHRAKLSGIPPSGKKIVWNEMVISRFEDSEIAEEWVVSELAGQMMARQSPQNIVKE